MRSPRHRQWHAILIPCAMLAYVIVAYTRYWSYQPEVFPVSAWGMFAVQERFVSEFGVRQVEAVSCSAPTGGGVPGDSPEPAASDLDLMPLDARRRQLAAAAYGLEARDASGAEHLRALLEEDLLADGVCYELIALKLDSWSKPPGRPRLRGRVGPFLSPQTDSGASYRSKGRGKLSEKGKSGWIDKKRKQP